MAANGASSLPCSPTKRRGAAAAASAAVNSSAPATDMGMDVLKKIVRRIKPFEQVGLLGFFFFTSALFLLLIFCFLYSGNRVEVVAHRASDGVGLGGGWRLGVEGVAREAASGGGECNLFEGEWVWDERYPLYNSTDCAFIDLGFRCSENGRPDNFYSKWRWQPSRCDLPRGCYFQIGDRVYMNITVDGAYQRSIKTLFDWIQQEVNTTSTQVIFRTYSPVHFSGGDWKSGGNCHMETVPVLGNSQVSLKPWSKFLKPFKSLNSDKSEDKKLPKIELLNITKMTARRKDGHLSLFYLGPSVRAPHYRQDCSHWCLPGVPDAWNELLYSLFMRRESMEKL